MKRVALAAALLSVFAAAGASADTAQTAVRLRFPGLNGGGKVVVALFADEGRWRAREGALRSVEAPVSGASVEAVFQGLPPGRYAVMAFHDRNGDGRLNTLPVGLPTEPYGFSNDARGVFGPPSWRAAQFEAAPGRPAAQAIRLR